MELWTWNVYYDCYAWGDDGCLKAWRTPEEALVDGGREWSLDAPLQLVRIEVQD